MPKLSIWNEFGGHGRKCTPRGLRGLTANLRGTCSAKELRPVRFWGGELRVGFARDRLLGQRSCAILSILGRISVPLAPRFAKSQIGDPMKMERRRETAKWVAHSGTL